MEFTFLVFCVVNHHKQHHLTSVHSPLHRDGVRRVRQQHFLLTWPLSWDVAHQPVLSAIRKAATLMQHRWYALASSFPALTSQGVCQYVSCILGLAHLDGHIGRCSRVGISYSSGRSPNGFLDAVRAGNPRDTGRADGNADSRLFCCNVARRSAVS